MFAFLMFRVQFSLLSNNNGPATFLVLDIPRYRQHIYSVFVIYDLQYDTELRSYINKNHSCLLCFSSFAHLFHIFICVVNTKVPFIQVNSYLLALAVALTPLHSHPHNKYTQQSKVMDEFRLASAQMQLLGNKTE